MYTAVHSLCTDTSAGYPPQFPFRLNIVTLIACIREKIIFPWQTQELVSGCVHYLWWSLLLITAPKFNMN